MLKYYITILHRQFTKTLNQFSKLSRAKKKKMEIRMPALDNVLINGNYLKNTKKTVYENILF